MANYWLEQLELEEVAHKLAGFLKKYVDGRRLIDPDDELRRGIIAFFHTFPTAKKFQGRLSVEGEIAPTNDGHGSWVTKIKVSIY